MEILSREQVVSAADLTPEEFEVPEWHGAVMLRGMTGAEREKNEMSGYLARQGKPKELENIRARTVMWCVTDADGNSIFRSVEEVLKKSGAVVNRLFERIVELSGVSTEGEEEAEKNSSDPSDASGSS